MDVSINKLSVINENSLYYDPGFRRMLELNMAWLRNHPETTVIAVDPHDTYKYEGDLYGLLQAYGVRRELHWVIMRLNNIDRAGQVDENLLQLLIPDLGLIDRLRQNYQTARK